MAQFDYERLDVYPVAVDFVALANDLAEPLGGGDPETTAVFLAILLSRPDLRVVVHSPVRATVLSGVVL